MDTFSVPQEIVTKIEDKILECLMILQKRTNLTLNIPTWEFKQMGRAAGKAKVISNHIYINPDYLLNGNLERMINQTVPHEIAHLVEFALYGTAGHGFRWKSLMMAMGLRPDRCHDMSTEGVKTRARRKIDYKCDCCGTTIPLTQYRHNQVSKGIKIFHTKCGRRGTLTQVGKYFTKK